MHARSGVWAAAAFARTSAPAITVREREPSRTQLRLRRPGGRDTTPHRSLFDPWHEFEVLELLDAQYLGGYNSPTTGTAAVLKKY
jgi:hypothetical protein